MKDCNEQVKGFERAAVRMSKDDRADIFGKAKINRDRLRSGLDRNGSPKAIGSRTQGSYAMKTMIQHDRNDYDVDDGVYFKRDKLKDNQGQDKSPEDARKMVSDALQDKRFADQPEPRDNCVRIYYKSEGYHVDVPVYRENRERTRSPAPRRNGSRLPLAISGDSPILWRTRNGSSTPTTTNRPTPPPTGTRASSCGFVRMVKAFARSRWTWTDEIASGFTISKLCCDNFARDDGRDDRSFRETLKGVSLQLALNVAVRHPVLNENLAEPGDAKTTFLEGKDRREPQTPRSPRPARLHARRRDEGMGRVVLHRLVLKAARSL